MTIKEHLKPRMMKLDSEKSDTLAEILYEMEEIGDIEGLHRVIQQASMALAKAARKNS